MINWREIMVDEYKILVATQLLVVDLCRESYFSFRKFELVPGNRRSVAIFVKGLSLRFISHLCSPLIRRLYNIFRTFQFFII
jgi:hypothetical protein